MTTKAYDYEHIRVDVETGVAWATLDNPPINLITCPSSLS